MKSSQVATRLTCFAILTAIEVDIRELISSSARQASKHEILRPELRKKTAVRQEDALAIEIESSSSDFSLLDYTDFGDLAIILSDLASVIDAIPLQITKEIANKLNQLSAARNRVCHSRPLEPDDFSSFFDFSTYLVSQCSQSPWKTLKDTLARLEAEPTYVLTLRIPKFWSPNSAIPHNLPLPEFDDTGFLGRQLDRKELTRLLTSSHPVITLTGEGGVGKTALLLRCLYDLVDSPNIPYQAIVWVSLKSKYLTRTGVQQVQGAITSTLGMYQAIGDQLGIPNTSNSTEEELLNELIDYLAHFKILLAFDNLETVDPQNLRKILAPVPQGSKIVITSRIGLGEIELRYPVSALDVTTAAILLRRYSKALHANDLAAAADSDITNYCSKLYFNPLLIKWFVSCVANGSSPDAILKPGGTSFKDIVKFCFENLYSKLTDEEKLVIQVLASARRPLSTTELYYLTSNISRLKVDWALNTLNRSSIVRTQIDSKSGIGANSYALTEIASEFMVMCAPPSQKIFTDVQNTLRKIRQTVENENLQRLVYKYQIKAIHAESSDQKLCASLLRSALQYFNANDITNARNFIEQAKSYLPSFSECYRISAIIESDLDLYKATIEYERATELAPKSTIAYYSFALFFIKYLEDYQAALEQIDHALIVDQDDPTLLSARALCLTRLGQYPSASEIYKYILKGLADRPRKWRIATYDQAAECYLRWSERNLVSQDYEQSINQLGEASNILQFAFAQGDFDEKFIQKIAKLLGQNVSISLSSNNPKFAQEFVNIATCFESYYPEDGLAIHGYSDFVARFSGSSFHAQIVKLKLRDDYDSNRQERLQNQASTERRYGVIKALPNDAYGFIFGSDRKDYFFSLSQVIEIADRSKFIVGSLVSFELGENRKGVCAVRVSLAEPILDSIS